MTLSTVDENNSSSIMYTMLYRLPIYRKNSYCIQVKVYYYAHTIITYYIYVYRYLYEPLKNILLLLQRIDREIPLTSSYLLQYQNTLLLNVAAIFFVIKNIKRTL